ncbi:conserved hypothetical protein [Ricinus communis]|uniref:Uncharacterized protein n=1 Tax=Ricinus communis TaxID=3988 RepID=B9RHQ8_RICCO|nr:conserved hypothetical protein [Ricinus communis]
MYSRLLIGNPLVVFVISGEVTLKMDILVKKATGPSGCNLLNQPGKDRVGAEIN